MSMSVLGQHDEGFQVVDSAYFLLRARNSWWILASHQCVESTAFAKVEVEFRLSRVFSSARSVWQSTLFLPHRPQFCHNLASALRCLRDPEMYWLFTSFMLFWVPILKCLAFEAVTKIHI